MFFGAKVNLFPNKVAVFYLHTLHNQMDGFPVSLSAIEAIQQKHGRAKWAEISRSQNQLRLTLEIFETVKKY